MDVGNVFWGRRWQGWGEMTGDDDGCNKDQWTPMMHDILIVHIIIMLVY